MRRHSTPDDPLRSLTRLTIGAALLSFDELQRQVRLWEDRTARQLAEQRKPVPVVPRPAPTTSQMSTPPVPSAPVARYALIGLIFDLQSRVSRTVGSAARVDQELGNLVAPLLAPLATTPALAPMRQRVEAWITRGESEVERWVALGRAEEQHSRVLVQTALDTSVETSIHQVVTNPEVLDLIQEQGTDLAHEVIEEVRERAVSTDTFLERLVRVVLRRPPRETLPEPPEAVRVHAVSLRSHES